MKNKNKELPAVFKVETAEQETLIGWIRGDKEIEIYTCDNMMLTKLKKLMEKGGDQYWVKEVYKDGEGNCVGVKVMAPQRCMGLRAGNKKEMSDEQKEKLRVRMKKMVEKREQKKNEDKKDES